MPNIYGPETLAEYADRRRAERAKREPEDAKVARLEALRRDRAERARVKAEQLEASRRDREERAKLKAEAAAAPEARLKAMETEIRAVRRAGVERLAAQRASSGSRTSVR